jgi:NAD(P)-dependent dehydrogenase (short-subunit alcohol dehydrogenase family)
MPEVLDYAPLVMDKTPLKRDALAGEVAVVTGGAGTIGLAISRSLAWLGARIVVAARNPTTGSAAAELVNRENKPGTAIYVSTDVTSEPSVKAMAEKAFEIFGKVDILVNNAMDMSHSAPILKTTAAAMDSQYAVAVRGALHCIQAFVPGMQQRHHGVVSYISTTFRYPSGPSNYCAVKAATSSMMMSLAAELGPVKETGISVFMFTPTLTGRPRSTAIGQARAGAFVVLPSMVGYGSGPVPPEDCGAAFAYCIVRAPEIHASGVNAGQAQKRLKWPFPKPETAPPRDFDRIRNQVEARLFGYIGPGWQDKFEPLVTVDRSKSPPDEDLGITALYDK